MDCIGYRDSGELSDIKIVVDDIEFNLHKFPLFVRSNYFKSINFDNSGKVGQQHIVKLDNFPGGSKVFALIADYCYNKEIHVDATNVVNVKCAAEYLQMFGNNGKGGLCLLADNILFDILYVAKSKRNYQLILELIDSAIKYKDIVEKCKLHVKLLESFVENLVSSIKLNSAYNYTIDKKQVDKSDLPLRNSDIRVLNRLPVKWMADLCKFKVHTNFYKNTIAFVVQSYIDFNTSLNPNYTFDDKPDEPEEPAQQQPDQQSKDETANPKEEAREPREKIVPNAESDDEKLDLIQSLAAALNESYPDIALPITWLMLYTNALNKLKADDSTKTIFAKWLWNALNNIKRNSEELSKIPTEIMVQLAEDISKEDSNSHKLEKLVDLIDRYVIDMQQKNKLTAETFCNLTKSIPKEHRHSYDNLAHVLLSLLKNEHYNIDSDKQKELLDLIDFHKLNETTLELCKNSDFIPPQYITEAALALCAKLRKELDEYKSYVKTLEATTSTKVTSTSSAYNSYTPQPSSLAKYPTTASYSSMSNLNSTPTFSIHQSSRPKTSSSYKLVTTTGQKYSSIPTTTTTTTTNNDPINTNSKARPVRSSLSRRSTFNTNADSSYLNTRYKAKSAYLNELYKASTAAINSYDNTIAYNNSSDESLTSNPSLYTYNSTYDDIYNTSYHRYSHQPLRTVFTEEFKF